MTLRKGDFNSSCQCKAKGCAVKGSKNNIFCFYFYFWFPRFLVLQYTSLSTITHTYN